MHRKTLAALNAIETMMKFGQLESGKRFPSERKLGEMLHIGRGAVRTVLLELEQSGKVRILDNGRRELLPVAGVATPVFHRFLMATPLRCNSFEALNILGQLSEFGALKGVEMVLSASNDWRNIPERCQAGRYQAVAFFESFDADVADSLESSGVPAMVTNAEVICQGVPSVGVNFRQVGHLAGRTLFDAGHRRIGYIGGTADSYMTREMIAGLKGALAEDDITPDFDSFLSLAYGGTDALSRMIDLLKRPHRPSAFMVGRDYLVQYFVQACHELKIRIPEDISVIGYDNLSWPDAAAHGLTTITEPATAIARETIALLERLAAGNHSMDTVRLPGELIRRHSVGPILPPKC